MILNLINKKLALNLFHQSYRKKDKMCKRWILQLPTVVENLGITTSSPPLELGMLVALFKG